MSIVSFSFVIFIAALCLLYFIVPKKIQWVVLLAASCVFYLSAGWKCAYYIVITIVSQYILAIKLENQTKAFKNEVESQGLSGKAKGQCKKKYQRIKKRYVAISVLINIGLLAFVKYAEVFVESLYQIIGKENMGNASGFHILVPLGISFYTFKSLTYVIDVYRGREKAERNIFKLALYISYFPSIIQGPIDRYGDIADQLTGEHKFDYRRFLFGVQRILWGYIKKLVVADRIAVVVNQIFGDYIRGGYSGVIIFLGAFLYGFQIYADFSSGMDIVLGVSEIFDIHLTENFNHPYLSKSVAEFWQRWHITLGAWMKKYLFYPLSLSEPFTKLNTMCRKTFGEKVGKVIVPSVASFIVFILVGIWHGVGWKYVVFGIYHAVLVSTHTLFADLYRGILNRLHIDASWNIWKIFQVLRTVFLISIGRIFSRAADIREAMEMFRLMLRDTGFKSLADGTLYKLGLNEKNFQFMILTIIVIMAVDILQERGMRMRETIAKQNIVLRWAIYLGAIAVLIIFGTYGETYNAANFIYMRF